MTDTELVQASRRGERAAFGALIERYQGVVCAVSYSRTGDRALSEDVAQETFLEAWRSLDRLREVVKLRAWLCGIARNLARKAKRRTEREVELAGEIIDGETPFDAAADAEMDRVVRTALDRVPEAYREPLVMYYCEGLSARDIAGALGISEAAAMQRLSRGRQYLAAGVDDIVERALRGRRVRRNLVAAVLAALPALPAVIPSRADASPTHGGHMLKLALVAATGLAATGATALVINHARSDASPAAAAATPVAVAIAPPSAPAAAQAPAIAAARTAQPSLGAAPHAYRPTTDPNDPQPLPPPVEHQRLHQLGLDVGPSRGPADAPVTIVMFTDAKCPYCQRVLGTIDEVWDQFPGKLRLVVKQFPVHDSAILAAEASLAAQAQDKYWAFHDQMFANADDLGHDQLIEDARLAGLDVAAFRSALDQHAFAPALAAEEDAAKQIDVSATPSFLINGKHFIGAQPADAMKAEIVAALGAAQ